MKHHVKLVKGNEDVISQTNLNERKKLVTVKVSLSEKELSQMKALSGLSGKVSDHLIVREYLKSKVRYGW